MKLGTLSADELRELQGRITKELEVRERIRVETEFIKQRMRALEEIAKEHGIVSFDDLPDGLSLPGQVVEFAGKAYKNVASLEISTPPNTPVNVWEQVTEEAPPAEEPLPDSPEDEVVPGDETVEEPDPETEITPEPEPEIPAEEGTEEEPVTEKDENAPVGDEVTEPEIVDTV